MPALDLGSASGGATRLLMEWLADPFPGADPEHLPAFHALWGGMPRHWELAEPFGLDIDGAVATLVLDPAGPLRSTISP